MRWNLVKGGPFRIEEEENKRDTKKTRMLSSARVVSKDGNGGPSQQQSEGRVDWIYVPA
jgi:hypothetical protein